MNIEEKVRQVLIAIPAVTALVGAGKAARVRTDELAEKDTLPAIIVAVESADYELSLDGLLRWATPVVSLTCRDWTRQGSRALAQAIEDGGLKAYSGADFDAYVEASRTEATDPGDGSDRWWYDTVLTVQLMYGE